MLKVAIICLRVVIGALALFVAMLNALAVLLVGMFHLFLGPFIGMARDLSAAITGTPPTPPHRSFLLLRLAIILAVAIGMFVSVAAPPYRRLLHAVALGAVVALCCWPWHEVAAPATTYYLVLAILWLGYYVICLTRRDAPRLNLPG